MHLDIPIFLLPKKVSILPFQESHKLPPNEESVPEKRNKKNKKKKEETNTKKKGTPENRVEIKKRMNNQAKPHSIVLSMGLKNRRGYQRKR